jgi:hypothetical protein
MDEFFLTKPTNLFKLEILPTSDMSNGQKLNALTRLILLITLVLLILWHNESHWWKFLLCGIIIIVILYLSIQSSDKEYVVI